MPFSPEFLMAQDMKQMPAARLSEQLEECAPHVLDALFAVWKEELLQDDEILTLQKDTVCAPAQTAA